MPTVPIVASDIQVDSSAGQPLYRQIAAAITAQLSAGQLASGERLPTTRELAEHLGLNRATISSAYKLLEEEGILTGQVGRGSFIAPGHARGPHPDSEPEPDRTRRINFASSRPSAAAFPLSAFRKSAHAVIESAETPDILQLGSPYGYGPLRRYLLEQDREAGLAGPDDDILITNGCQQALDLLARAYTASPHQANATSVLLEDPVYHGLLRIFERAGARLLTAPVTAAGLDLDRAEELLERHRPRLLVVTPDFQNPTGVTLPLAARQRLADLARRTGALLVENAIYRDLRYLGESLPPLKQLSGANTVLLRSFSKIGFPGLRVGWVTAPREVIRRLVEEKQIADLHSDHLAQAIALEFAASGELAAHIDRTCALGRKRLAALSSACHRHLPAGTHWTATEGGMSIWIEFPPYLSAARVLARTEAEGVDFLPGPNFSPSGAHRSALRLSFGGLSPDAIERGLHILGAAARAELSTAETSSYAEPEMATV